MPSRAQSQYRRQGSGMMNLDSLGRRNTFRNNRQNRDTFNTYRRRSNGGMGG